ncbi:MAG: DoxX family protein [Candidatus Acidiferrales bacterium]
MSRAGDVGLMLLRAGIGAMLLGYHGWGKLKGATAFVLNGADWGMPATVANIGLPFPAFFAVCAALAESVGATLLAAGLYTRYAAAVVAFNMLVAAYFHSRTDWRVEFALLYLLPALLFVVAPPGRFSLDALLRGGGRAKK